MPDRIGQQLGQYRLTRLLGQGGFAEVYLGEHTRLNSQAAIKVLRQHVDSTEVDNFLNEARTIASLYHPHIIRVFDFDVDAGIPFIVMDYAPAGSLRLRHQRGTIVPLPTIVLYVKQIAHALQYAHDEKKLIHRDIKPENMLISRYGEILLSDFGIATLSQSSHSQSTKDIVGTVGYMAPEQIQGKPRPASDLYSLGVVVYEWLCGDRPFQGSFIEVATQQMLASPPPLREKIPTISLEIEQVVLTALAKDPHNRFGSVQAFAHSLEQASKSSPSAQITPIAPVSKELPPVAQYTPVPKPISLASEVSLERKAPSTENSFTLETQEASFIAHSQDTSSKVLPTQDTSSKVLPMHIPRKTETPTPIAGGSLLTQYRAHTGWIRTLAWFPDGTRLASAGEDKIIHIWNASNGAPVLTFVGHSKRVNAVACSPDGTRLASASNDQTVRIWDTRANQLLYTYLNHQNMLSWVNAVTWLSYAANILISAGNDRTVHVWDSAGNQHVRYQQHQGWVNAVTYSPQELRVADKQYRLIASASDDKTLHVWDARTGNQVFVYRGHAKRVSTVSWIPSELEGRRIVSGSDDKTIQVWDAISGQVFFTCRENHAISAVVCSPNGKYIAVGSYKTVRFYDATNGNVLFLYTGHTDWVRTLAWSPDGKRFASAGDDRTVHVIQVNYNY